MMYKFTVSQKNDNTWIVKDYDEVQFSGTLADCWAFIEILKKKVILDERSNQMNKWKYKCKSCDYNCVVSTDTYMPPKVCVHQHLDEFNWQLVTEKKAELPEKFEYLVVYVSGNLTGSIRITGKMETFEDIKDVERLISEDFRGGENVVIVNFIRLKEQRHE